jgi:uncharacterized membrane protein YkvI
MSLEFKNSFKIACMIIGAIVGAGFASGQEILQFFTIFGQKGILGICCASILFFIISLATLELTYRYGYRNYEQFIEGVAGKKLGRVIENTVMLFLLFCFFIMIVGASALLEQLFGLPAILGTVMTLSICYLLFHYKLKGVVLVNQIVSPMLVIGICLIGFYFFSFNSIETFNNQTNGIIGNWSTAWISYVGYNSIKLIAVLVVMIPYINSKKVVFGGSLLGAGFVLIMAIVIFVLDKMFYPVILNVELPVLEIVKQDSMILAHIYSFIALTDMITSAATSGFCFLNKFSEGADRKFNNYAIVICLMAIPFSFIGFANSVKIVYPIFGYIGLLQVVLVIGRYILVYPFRFNCSVLK